MYYSWKDIQHVQERAYIEGHEEGYRLGKQDSDMMNALDNVDIEQVQRERDLWKESCRESQELRCEEIDRRIEAEKQVGPLKDDKAFWKFAAMTLLAVNVGIAIAVAWGCS